MLVFHKGSPFTPQKKNVPERLLSDITVGPINKIELPIHIFKNVLPYLKSSESFTVYLLIFVNTRSDKSWFTTIDEITKLSFLSYCDVESALLKLEAERLIHIHGHSILEIQVNENWILS